MLSKKQRALRDAGRMQELFATLPKRTPRKAVTRTKRSQSEYERIYGSTERCAFVESLPCCGCDVEGYSVNAHVTKDASKGMGRKAGYQCIAPLCGSRFGAVGCHELYDRHEAPFDNEVSRVRIMAYAAITESRWQAECARRGG